MLPHFHCDFLGKMMIWIQEQSVDKQSPVSKKTVVCNAGMLVLTFFLAYLMEGRKMRKRLLIPVKYPFLQVHYLGTHFLK